MISDFLRCNIVLDSDNFLDIYHRCGNAASRVEIVRRCAVRAHSSDPKFSKCSSVLEKSYSYFYNTFSKATGDKLKDKSINSNEIRQQTFKELKFLLVDCYDYLIHSYFPEAVARKRLEASPNLKDLLATAHALTIKEASWKL
eukprot:TRINITY_DN6819_c0_g1_i5.p1 TRINITY_DN6819_c0_g1~~TRINITY_DN6819_c0_g1_i5.p1  ORF type:complete len:143 (-),score=17.15 TRINITY_DN6819_c0_g1_i5:159-587(-)